MPPSRYRAAPLTTQLSGSFLDSPTPLRGSVGNVPGHHDNGERFVYFRFLARLPLTVTFASAIFDVAVDSITYSANSHEIKGKQRGTCAYALIGPCYRELEWLELAAYEVGLRVRCVTVGETIMRRLVREGRAELVDTPTRDPVDLPRKDPGRFRY